MIDTTTPTEQAELKHVMINAEMDGIAITVSTRLPLVAIEGFKRDDVPSIQLNFGAIAIWIDKTNVDSFEIIEPS